MAPRAARWSCCGAVVAVTVVLASCGGGGGGQGLASGRPSTSATSATSTPSTPSTGGVTTSSDQGTTTSTAQRPTTTERTTTTTAPATTTTTPRTTTTSRATTTTEGALPATSAATSTPATTPASTSEEGDTGLWWLLLLVIVIVGLVVWMLTRPKKKPIDERWRAQAEQLATDMDSVSHLLLAGADAGGAIADDRWTGVLNRSGELRRLAANVAAGAPNPELRDAILMPVDALRSLELSVDAARLHVVGASAAARADGDRVAAALLRLRETLNPAAKAQH